MLLGAGPFVGSGAYAQTAGPLWDPTQLPETRGVLKQYTLTPRGDVDGLILADGTEVKFPPHLTGQIVFAVRPGDAVTIRGLRAVALPLVDATSVTNEATRVTVVDNGPPDGPGRATIEQTISGRVVLALHGKRGELTGAVLDNGTTLRLPPPEAARMQGWPQPGQLITVRGLNLTTPLGTVVDVTAIGSSASQLSEIAAPPPRGPGRRGSADFAPPSPPAFSPPPPPGPRG
jgi:hypothetical protein